MINDSSNKAIGNKKEDVKLQPFFFPEENKTIWAETLEEAQKQLLINNK